MRKAHLSSLLQIGRISVPGWETDHHWLGAETAVRELTRGSFSRGVEMEVTSVWLKTSKHNRGPQDTEAQLTHRQGQGQVYFTHGHQRQCEGKTMSWPGSQCLWLHQMLYSGLEALGVLWMRYIRQPSPSKCAMQWIEIPFCWVLLSTWESEKRICELDIKNSSCIEVNSYIGECWVNSKSTWQSNFNSDFGKNSLKKKWVSKIQKTSKPVNSYLSRADSQPEWYDVSSGFSAHCGTHCMLLTLSEIKDWRILVL